MEISSLSSSSLLLRVFGARETTLAKSHSKWTITYYYIFARAFLVCDHCMNDHLPLQPFAKVFVR